MSELAERLRDGEVVRGMGATAFAPALVEVYGNLGLDFVWLDFEHKGPSPADSHALENLVRAADGTGTELLVRLPTGDPWLVRKVLDTGVANLLVPRVETAAEIRKVARAMSFTGEEAAGGEAGDGNEAENVTGDRGVGNSRASGWGGEGYEPGNRSPGLGVMVETAAAVERIDEILSVPALDFVYLGAEDLAVSLGHPFETDHPEVGAAVDATTAACRDAGIPLGRSVGSPAAVSEAVAEGWRLLRYGDEMGAVRRAVADFEEGLPAGAAKD